jgi:Na+/H+ antiporter NhaA
MPRWGASHFCAADLEPFCVCLKDMNWQLARWWAVVNAAGALITMVGVEMNYAWHVQRHEFYPRPPGYAAAFLIQLFALTALGLLQVAVCCPLIALNLSRRRAFQLMLGVTVGIVSALFIPILGMFIISYLAVAAFLTLLPSGVVFGTMVGISRWRSVNRASAIAESRQEQ